MTTLTASRRTVSKVERRAAIVAVAREIFLSRGYGATTMSYVAESLGGSKATLWAYFDSKDSLFQAVVEELAEEFQANLDDAFRPSRGLHRTLVDFCERFVTRLATPNAVGIYRLVIGEGGRFPAIGPLFYNRGPRRVIDRLADYIRCQVEIGALRSCDPVSAATQLIAQCQAGHLRSMYGVTPTRSAASFRRQAEEATELFLRAYSTDVMTITRPLVEGPPAAVC